MASITSQNQATRGRNDNKRGRGRRVNSRGGRGGSRVADQVEIAPVAATTIPNDADIATSVPTADEAISEDSDDVCWICAEKIKYFSISECNHTTCHVCALRLRALYKRQECTFCKVSFSEEPWRVYHVLTKLLISIRKRRWS